MTPPFTGCATAIVTPMRRGNIDYGALSALIDRQIEAGVSAIVPCGTTGEAPTLCTEEKRRLISYTVSKVRGKIPVIAGCGSPSTSHAAKFAAEAAREGASGVLCVTPYYNKATDMGIYMHYREIANACKIPVIAYTVPSRTGMDISEGAYEMLCTIPNLVGVKEASGNITRLSRLIAKFGHRLSFYSGCDDLCAPTYAVGGCGVVSVISNIMPKETVALCGLCEIGDMVRAAELQRQLAPLNEALFCEVSPIPIKTAMSILGHCSDEVRLPLCKISPQGEKKLRDAMEKVGLI